MIYKKVVKRVYPKSACHKEEFFLLIVPIWVGGCLLNLLWQSCHNRRKSNHVVYLNHAVIYVYYFSVKLEKILLITVALLSDEEAL